MNIIEKSFLYLVVLFLAVLAKFAYNAPDHRWPAKDHQSAEPISLVVINFAGAIKNPGRYHFVEGTTLRDALQAISLDKNSDINSLNLDRKLRAGETIKISGKGKGKGKGKG